MNKLQEIFTAYYRKFNPTPQEEALAADRYKICKECPRFSSYFGKKHSSLIQKCDECGCVISAKIFSPIENACPLLKWKDVDEKYFKKTKTIV